MNEEGLRAWAQAHPVLIDVSVGTVVMLVLVLRGIWWLRHNNVNEAIGELVKPPPAAAADPAVPAAPQFSSQAMRVWSWTLGAVGITAIAIAATSCWVEYDWLGAEVVRAPFVGSSTAAGTVTASYRVASATRPPFVAIFSYTPKSGGMASVGEAMRITRVVEIHRGEPLQYREYSRSSSKDLQGWPLIELYAGLGAAFGGVFLLFAFKCRP